MQLRSYQIDRMVQPVRHAFATGAKRPLLTAPTGAGKTATFSYMMRHAVDRGNPSWVMVHRDLLVRQASRSLTAWGCPHGILSAGGEMDEQLAQVVSIQTLSARLKKGWVPKVRPRFLISDECHHSCSDSWLSVFTSFRDVPTLGVTATPCRLDGKGLGAVFDRLVIGPTTAELMDLGYLVRPQYWGVPLSQLPDLSKVGTEMGDFSKADLAKEMEDRPCLTGDAVAHYKRRADGLKFVGFACNIKHANSLRDAFVSAGIPCEVIHGGLSDSQREDMVERLDRGEIRGLWSVDLISEGFDLPEVSCAILCRPTKSLSLHLQQLGRVLRMFPGKTGAVVLDHAGNCTREGLGLAEGDYQWSLDGIVKKPKEEEVLTEVRQCSNCFANYLPAPCCPACGHASEVKERVIKLTRGELREIRAAEIAARAEERRKAKEAKRLRDEEEKRRKAQARRAQGQARDIAALIAHARGTGCKNPAWRARKILWGRQAKR